jgi:hypothetical protein
MILFSIFLEMKHPEEFRYITHIKETTFKYPRRDTHTLQDISKGEVRPNVDLVY